MAQQISPSVQNSFIAGFKTEFTGLNFPENAATDVDNCIFSLIGDVTRREGINYETNFTSTAIDRTEKAISSFRWLNAGGDGLSQILVVQTGNTLYFYLSSAATVTNPLSTQLLPSTVIITSFLPSGSLSDPSMVECQYTSGNGYLFVFHPYLDPFYCTYNAGTITANVIPIQIRDFTGIPESIPDNQRPLTLSIEHNYNLSNQGWTNAPSWSTSSSTNVQVSGGTHTFTVAASLPISPGQFCTVQNTSPYPGTIMMTGTVGSYSGTTLVFNTVYANPTFGAQFFNNWFIYSNNVGYINTWFTAAANYPSNSDVWWEFKDSSNLFNPSSTINNVTLDSGPAPKGFYILNAFNQQRSVISAISGLTNVTTFARPKTGTWFQGRVWYAGVDASFMPSGDQPFSTWTENIYFSQIVVTTSDFGQCYQTNDPTSENLFDLLPTDGGTITIQGSGSIYKLFPIQNGLLVFASNGIWFITGSQGIGFSATDYTITKISSVQAISSTAFVDVLGFPVFWNEEGIYKVQPSQQGGGLTVDNLALGTILSFYSSIPLQSKKFARGDYNQIDYVIQWAYRSTNETDITSRYQFDSVLNFNTANKAFYPYGIATNSASSYIHDIKYIVGPGGSTSPDPVFKYLTSLISSGAYKFTFSEENDDTFVDWFSQDSIGVNFVSFFETGFSLQGLSTRKFQPIYVGVYSRNDTPNSYKIQSVWDYASSGNSGKISSQQVITNNNANFSMLYRRHKLRGHGLVLQLQFTSVDGQPFDIMGWSMINSINASM